MTGSCASKNNSSYEIFSSRSANASIGGNELREGESVAWFGERPLSLFLAEDSESAGVGLRAALVLLREVRGWGSAGVAGVEFEPSSGVTSDTFVVRPTRESPC
jgi:hypothetical protein